MSLQCGIFFRDWGDNMKHVLIVSKVDKLEEYLRIAKEYHVSFEINDFFDAKLLDDEKELENVISMYKEFGIPQDSTMHGAFLDLAINSSDAKIREISEFRMVQSMEIARRLGLKAVIFHTNYNPDIPGEAYKQHLIEAMVSYLSRLLKQYPDIEIYVENMFDKTPDVLEAISIQLQEYQNYGVCLDWAHVNVYGRLYDEWVKSLYPYVKHIHISDNDYITDIHFPLGNGKINWNEFMEYYYKYFKDASVLIETNHPDYQRDSLEYLKELLLGKNTKLYNFKAEELLEKIFYYMNELTIEKDFSESILLLTELGRTLVNADRTSFWYRDVRNNSYWTMGASGTGRIVVPKGQGLVGASIENNETILINNPYQDARFNPQVDKETGYVTKAILCMPVINSCGEVIGAYQAINKVGSFYESTFCEQDKKRLALAAVYSGKLLEAYLLRVQSRIDSLTGLKNRRGFYEYYVLLPKKNHSKSIIMGDIDFFKRVNDTYGHNAGDKVLQHVANIIRECVGGAGEVFRWGGEEMIVLLPEYDLQQTAELAEKIRSTIEQSVCVVENASISVTMSFGIKQMEDDLTLEENIKDVDENLYEAKKTGRNKVVK